MGLPCELPITEVKKMYKNYFAKVVKKDSLIDEPFGIVYRSLHFINPKLHLIPPQIPFMKRRNYLKIGLLILFHH